jgi:hypothetical protein
MAIIRCLLYGIGLLGIYNLQSLIMNNTPMKFLEEKWLMVEYREWQKQLTGDRWEYMRARYQRLRAEKIAQRIESKRNQ